MASDHSDSDLPEPPQIRLLRRLVTTLTLTLTLGMIVIVGLMVWRLGPMATSGVTAPAGPAEILLPAEIILPEGEVLTGYAQNPDWTVLITTDEGGTQRIHLLRPGEAAPAQTTTITAGAR